MARNKITDLSATAAENTDIQNVNVAEGMSPGGVNNALRALAGMLGDAFALATPGTKLKTVQAEKFHVAADADQIEVGTTKPTTVKHDNTQHITTIDATRSLTIKIGESGDAGASAFELVENDGTLGDITVLKQTNSGGLQVGNAALNSQRAAANNDTAAMTVTGTLSATKFVGDGSALTNIGAGSGSTPVGLIAMWSGSIASLPDGWALCDGQSGRPDLRNKFIMGAGAGSGYSDTGSTGGSNGLTLSEAQLPSHTHSAGSIGDNHRHSVADVQIPAHSHDAGNMQVSSHSHQLTNTSHRHSVQIGKTAYLVPTLNYQQSSYDVLVDETSAAGGSRTFNTSNEDAGNSTDAQNVALTGSTGSVVGTPTLGAGQQTGVPQGSGLGGTSGSAGSGSEIDNRPAFYALAFIIFEGSS